MPQSGSNVGGGSVAEQLQQALALHKGGQREAAAALYRDVLRRQPESEDALHLLGVLYLELERAAEALPLLEQCVALAPGIGSFQNNLGRVYAALQRPQDALRAYARAAELQPGSVAILANLGRAHVALGAWEQALACYRTVIALRVGSPELLLEAARVCEELAAWDEALTYARRAYAVAPEQVASRLAQVLVRGGLAKRQAGEDAAAEEAYREALRVDARYGEAHAHLGNVLRVRERMEEACGHYEAALDAMPGQFETLTNLGVTLGALKRWPEAKRAFERAVAAAPDFAEAHYNLGLAHHSCGEYAEAVAQYRWAIALDPAARNAQNNLANLLKEWALVEAPPDMALLEEAEAAYREAIRLDPEYPEAHHNLALLLLLRGRMEEGWREYEWRDRIEGFSKPGFPQPVWKGELAPDSTILVYAEQGHGDTLQFCRYLPWVRARCRQIVVACHRPLVTLLRRAFPEVEVVPAPGPVPLFDLQIPLMSLAALAGDWQPSHPYLHANPLLCGFWAEKLEERSGMRVGIAWRGNPEHKRDAVRSVPAAALLPLLQKRGITFYSLQKDAPQADSALLQDAGMVDRTAELHDFDDTAGLMAQLDLVIACDTAVLHLAGALGKKAWAMLPSSPDWRWGLEGERCAWYPAMRLFRQQRAGEWSSVVEAMAVSL